jgi:hypothetical protein
MGNPETQGTLDTKKPGVRDLLKVLTKASAHIDDGSDKEITTTNDESEDDEVKPPTVCLN